MPGLAVFGVDLARPSILHWGVKIQSGLPGGVSLDPYNSSERQLPMTRPGIGWERSGLSDLRLHGASSCGQAFLAMVRDLAMAQL